MKSPPGIPSQPAYEERKEESASRQKGQVGVFPIRFLVSTVRWDRSRVLLLGDKSSCSHALQRELMNGSS